MLLLFPWILKLHLLDLILQDERKQKRHIDFHLINFFFFFLSSLQVSIQIIARVLYWTKIFIFKTDYSRLAFFRVASQVESSNSVISTNVNAYAYAQMLIRSQNTDNVDSI